VHDPGVILPKADTIRQATSHEQLVAIVTTEWSPELLYYADRRGLMVHGGATPSRLAALRDEGYVIFHCPVLWGPGTCTLGFDGTRTP
jgi:hypothetical protein